MFRHEKIGLYPLLAPFGIVPAVGLLTEVKRAFKEIMADEKAALFWNPILSQIPPSFLQRCEEAVTSSNDFIRRTLSENMFSDLEESERAEKLERATALLSNVLDGKAHNTHFQIDECEKAGLKVERLEEDQKLQDLTLTIHHCYMHTLSNTPAFKIIENQLGRAMVKMQQQQFLMQTPIAPQAVPVPTPPDQNDAPAPPVNSIRVMDR